MMSIVLSRIIFYLQLNQEKKFINSNVMHLVVNKYNKTALGISKGVNVRYADVVLAPWGIRMLLR